MSNQHIAQLIICYDSTTNQALPLVRGMNTIGRLPQHNNLAIKHRQISTNHAQLYINETKIILTDKGSKNGTFLLETRQKLQKGKQNLIQQGEQFLFGTIVCQVKRRKNRDQLTKSQQKYQDQDVFGINQKFNNHSYQYQNHKKVINQIIVQQQPIQLKVKNQNKNEKSSKVQNLHETKQQLDLKKSDSSIKKPIIHNKSKDGKNLLKNKKASNNEVNSYKNQQIQIDKLKQNVQVKNKKDNKKIQQKSQKKQKNKSLQVKNKQKQTINKSQQNININKKDIKNKKETKKQKQSKLNGNENLDSQNIKKVKQPRKRVPKMTQQSESKTKSKQKALVQKKKQQKKQKSSKMIIQKQQPQHKKSPKRSQTQKIKKITQKSQKHQNLKKIAQKPKNSQKAQKSLKKHQSKISFVPITRFMVSGSPITFSLNPRLQCVKDISQEYDVLVMEQYNRTYKLLYSITRGIPIVNSRWLRDLSHLNPRQTISKFWLKLNNTNILKQSVQKVNQGLKIFNNHKFIIAMDKIHLGKDDLIKLIQQSGGQVIENNQASKKSVSKLKDVIVLLDEGYAQKDLKYAKTINQKKVYHVELVLEGILTQEPNWKKHQIHQ